MVARAASARRAPFLPESASRFLRRRAIELGGLMVLALAAVLALALVSYSQGDPSFNTATNSAVANVAGLPGAYAADLVLQGLGAAGAVLIALIAAWAWALISHRGLSVLWLRLAMAPACLAFAALGFAIIPAPQGWPLESGMGGALGAILSGGLLSLFPGWGAAPLAIVTLLLASITFVVALGLTWPEWRLILKIIYRVPRTIVLGGILLVHWARHARSAAPGRGPRGGLAAVQRVLHAIIMFGRAEARYIVAARGQAAAPEARREPVLGGAMAARRRAAPTATGMTKSTPRRARRRTAQAGQGTLQLDESKDYRLPQLDLLKAAVRSARATGLDERSLAENARLLESVLEDFGVHGQIIKVRPGPVVSLYELVPEPGTRTSRVIGLADDIARSMSALSVRVATIPGRNVIGIELPNSDREMVYLRELLASEAYENTAAKLTLALGKDISGNPVIADLARMPHLLVAGTTGSGKSVAINSMILSLIYRLPPEQCKLILIDPKMLELSVYDDIPHLLTPVVTEPGKAVVALKWTVREMESRYQAMSKLGVRNIAGYNKRLAEARARGEWLSRRVQVDFDPDTGQPLYEEQDLELDAMPFIVVVVDEMADLMLLAGKDIEGVVQRLAQMARAAGIHLIMATQRPSVDVITGTIKANFPTRISFHVTSKIDSRTILGEAGAEQLLGQGDMLYMEGGGRIVRVHGPFVSDREVERVADSLRAKGRPNYVTSVTEEPDSGAPSLGDGAADEPLYDQAVALIARERKASTSFVQRHLQIGYNCAARIIERMEAEGVVGQANHVGKREVLVGNVEP